MNKKLIIGTLIIVLTVVIGVVMVYNLIKNSVQNRESFELKIENLDSTPVDTVTHEGNEVEKGYYSRLVLIFLEKRPRDQNIKIKKFIKRNLQHSQFLSEIS